MLSKLDQIPFTEVFLTETQLETQVCFVDIYYIYVGWHIAHEWEEKSFPCLQESRRLAITRGRMTK